MKLQILSMAALAAFSCNALSGDGPYWTDVNGDIVRSATTGECIRSINWTPEDAIEGCDGKPVQPKPTAKSAPVVAVPIVAAGTADSDGDGVPDDVDKCPDSPADKPVDADGCTIVSVVLKNVQFESNSSELTAGSSESLDKVVNAMNEYDQLRIEIQAHTDSMGEASYNLSLSEKRANSVRDYLVAKGVAANRMEVKGLGETQPIADNSTRDGRATNRRVELKVID
jgi:outer membrane protein OmpA-like peptidoglycan-associated protein